MTSIQYYMNKRKNAHSWLNAVCQTALPYTRQWKTWCPMIQLKVWIIWNIYDLLNSFLTMDVLIKSIVFIHIAVDTWSGPSSPGYCPWEESCHGSEWNHGTLGWKTWSSQHVFRKVLIKSFQTSDVELEARNFPMYPGRMTLNEWNGTVEYK